MRDLIAPSSSVAVFPAHPFAVIYPHDAQSNTVDDMLRQMYTSGKVTEYPLRANETPQRIFEFDQPPTWLGAAMTPLEASTFDNGAQLIGYAVEADRVYTEWNLFPEKSDGLNYQYFVHFLNAAGDRIILWSVGSVPPETAAIRVGMYRLLDEGGYANANLIDAAGNPAGQSVEIPF